MSAPLEIVHEQLLSAGYWVAIADEGDGRYLKFENDWVLGFILFFPNAATLIDRWHLTSPRVLTAAHLALRRAEAKSWNTYLILLAEAPGDYGQNIVLGTIEEDLVGTRKIARAGIASAETARAALLPLLAVQSAPPLDAVDMGAEIRLRTSELPAELIEAFVTGASEATLAQLLETGQ